MRATPRKMEQFAHESSARPRTATLPAALAVGLFALIAWPMVLIGFVRGRGAHDQLNYHEQVIRTFAEQWPGFDFTNYLSATTPGYHVVLATLARTGLDQRWALQLGGSLFTIALIGLLAWSVSRRHGSRVPWAVSLAVVLPMVVSMPVYYSGVWLLPDNAGWLGVLSVWLIALRPRFDAWSFVLGAVTLVALVFVRQIHIWAMAMVLTAAWLGSDDDDGFRPIDEWRALTSEPFMRAARAGLALVAVAPAVILIAWFRDVWGGLTPPVFHERHEGGNLSAPAFVLAIFGMVAVFLVPFVTDGLRALWRDHRSLLAITIVASLSLALVAPTTYDEAAGRYSGLWDLARRLPAPGERSILVVPLATVGGVLLAAWFVSLSRRDRWVMLAAFVAFTAAQCVSFKLWQRYTEPFALIWLALAACRVAPAREGGGWRVVGPVALAGALGLVTIASLMVARPVKPRAILAPWETEAPMLPGMVEREPAAAEDPESPEG